MAGYRANLFLCTGSYDSCVNYYLYMLYFACILWKLQCHTLSLMRKIWFVSHGLCWLFRIIFELWPFAMSSLTFKSPAAVHKILRLFADRSRKVFNAHVLLFTKFKWRHIWKFSWLCCFQFLILACRHFAMMNRCVSWSPPHTIQLVKLLTPKGRPVT